MLPLHLEYLDLLLGLDEGVVITYSNRVSRGREQEAESR
jgi:hypothetical protein